MTGRRRASDAHTNERRLARRPVRRRHHAGVTVVAVCLTAMAGCAGGAPSRTATTVSTRGELERYVAQIEPIRLAVNRLLDGADPILGAFHDHRIRPAIAAQRMAVLERRFAAFTVDIAAIEQTSAALRALQAEYAHTYVLEDAYLSALVSGLAENNLAELPTTQSAQRAAIIDWRTGLTVLAQKSGVALPNDLQQAGRGEIAPSPEGSER